MLATCWPSWAQTPRLPGKAPVPEMNRAGPPLATLPPARDAPVPEARPSTGAHSEEATPIENAPVPSAKPRKTVRLQGGSAASVDKSPDDRDELPSDRRSTLLPQTEMPREEADCRAQLKALGAVFDEQQSEYDTAAGCAVPYPVKVSRFEASVDVAPPAELNCSMAKAMAQFVQEVVSQASREEFGADLKSVEQVSAFVCRSRHDASKISEHAYGNALDISGFTLSDGTRIDVEPKPQEKHARFLDKIRKQACGPFTTVLGPGSDPDHDRHFHLDLAPRRNGGTFCQ